MDLIRRCGDRCHRVEQNVGERCIALLASYPLWSWITLLLRECHSWQMRLEGRNHLATGRERDVSKETDA
jgi:hypothetical protein